MLQGLRRSTKSWTMRIILLGLAATFVVFFGQFEGGGHGGGGGHSNVLVEVDGVQLGAREISQAFNREIQAMQQVFGQQLDPDQARQLGLLDRAIGRLVTAELFAAGARDLGLAVSDDQVREAIFSLPQFQNGGGFDAGLFATFLARSGLSEAQFVETMRGDVARQLYVNAVQVGGAAPFTLAETLYKYREEQRTAETVVVPLDSFTDVAAPTDAEVTAYFETVRDVYQAPEYRRLTVASLTPAQYAEEIAVDEAEVEEEYLARQEEFHEPEQRQLQQAVFADEAAARAAKDRIDAGEAFDAVVQDVLGAPPLDLGQVVQADLFGELAEPAFALATGEVSQPVQSPLGWHLLLAGEVFEAQTATFEEVRDQLAQELSLSLARDDIFEVLESVEDTLAGGGTLEDAASENGLVVTTFDAVSRGGLDQSDTPMTDLPAPNQSITAAFSQQVGQDGDVIETDDGGFFLLRVDEVIESRPRELDEVREDVVTAWLDEQRQTLAQERADVIAAAVRDGQTMLQAASGFGLVAASSEPFNRTGGQEVAVPATLIDPLFEAAENEVVVAQTHDGFAVGRLLTVTEPTGSVGLIEVRDDLSNGFIADLQAQLAVALEDRFEVEINQDSIDTLF